jgi:hypothetical protein
MEFYLRHGDGPPPPRRLVLPEITEQIRHRGWRMLTRRAERKSADGPHLLLELARDVGVDREVAGVVGARGQLIDYDPAIANVK